VPSLLSEAISRLQQAPVIPEIEIQGEGSWVALETDSRRWAESLSRRLGEPVARLVSHDELGASLLDHPKQLSQFTEDLSAALEGRQLMVSSHRALEVANRAGLEVHHLGEHIEAPVTERVFHPCSGPRLEGIAQPFALQCCGARGALLEHHPGISGEVGGAAARELESLSHSCPDSLCSAHLRHHGADISDPIDWLLAAHPEP